jgi:hypothetical protein
MLSFQHFSLFCACKVVKLLNDFDKYKELCKWAGTDGTQRQQLKVKKD